MAGAGSFLSTAADMAKYLQAHWSDNPGISRDALRIVTRKHRPTDIPETSIGYAWHITSGNALDIVWHNGGAGGSRSYVAMLPDRKLGVIVLANWAQASVEDLGRKLIYVLQRRAASDPPAPGDMDNGDD